MVMGFGKYRGETYENIRRDDPQYCDWILGLESRAPVPTVAALIGSSKHFRTPATRPISKAAQEKHPKTEKPFPFTTSLEASILPPNIG